MHTDLKTLCISEHASLRDTIVQMDRSKLGIVLIVDEDRRLVGVVTDGDFKRLLNRTTDFMDIPVTEVMTGTPRSVHPDGLCVSAVKKMEEFSIISMPVVDDHNRVVGVVHLHDLMRARVI